MAESFKSIRKSLKSKEDEIIKAIDEYASINYSRLEKDMRRLREQEDKASSLIAEAKETIPKFNLKKAKELQEK